ncbi:hypothetical protein [Herpetosiphon llansteffanensis]|uniref:hypothetical protein n=1 Tax=Herpetosiphon llansteffanensis TaxID=2094568 RepID=UPI000D7C2C8B|nr:hypothetical protein [Herpetosiphon llansteffanensis]
MRYYKYGFFILLTLALIQSIVIYNKLQHQKDQAAQQRGFESIVAADMYNQWAVFSRQLQDLEAAVSNNEIERSKAILNNTIAMLQSQNQTPLLYDRYLATHQSSSEYGIGLGSMFNGYAIVLGNISSSFGNNLSENQSHLAQIRGIRADMGVLLQELPLDRLRSYNHVELRAHVDNVCKALQTHEIDEFVPCRHIIGR